MAILNSILLRFSCGCHTRPSDDTITRIMKDLIYRVAILLLARVVVKKFITGEGEDTEQERVKEMINQMKVKKLKNIALNTVSWQQVILALMDPLCVVFGVTRTSQ